MSWFTYILKCRDKSFYIGITNNLSQRILAHNSKKGAKSVMGKLPVKLVYYEEYPNKSIARKREIQLKKWSHLKKQLLIDGKIF